MNKRILKLWLFGAISILSYSVVTGAEVVKKMDKSDNVETIDLKDNVEWRAVNDSVMGGRSQGDSFETEAGNRIFKGRVSLENNGGFSSIRSFGGNYDLSASKGMEVKVRGDGRMYYFTARADNKRMIAFWYPIKTVAGEWMTVKVPFSSMYATSFGRKIKDLKLDTKNITSFGLMLYDKKAGDFNIELESLKVYK